MLFSISVESSLNSLHAAEERKQFIIFSRFACVHLVIKAYLQFDQPMRFSNAQNFGDLGAMSYAT